MHHTTIYFIIIGYKPRIATINRTTCSKESQMETKELIKLVPKNWTKQQLVEKVYGKDNTNGIDYAIPQPVADKLRALGNDSLFFYVWSYKEEDAQDGFKNTFGQLVNLAEKLFFKQGEKYHDTVHEYILSRSDIDIKQDILAGDAND